jgi:hypothetical protein
MYTTAANGYGTTSNAEKKLVASARMFLSCALNLISFAITRKREIATGVPVGIDVAVDPGPLLQNQAAS